MDAARADVSRRQDQLRGELPLDVEVVLHRVGGRGRARDGEGVGRERPVGEEREDVRERRVVYRHLLEEGRLLEGHVAVGRVEQLVEVEAEARAYGSLARPPEEAAERAALKGGAVGEADAGREVLLGGVAEERPRGHRPVVRVAHVGVDAVDLVRHGDELVAQP